MEIFKIYYSPHELLLTQFEGQVDFYLPEKSKVKPEVEVMYQPGRTIATTSLMTLEIIKGLILKQRLMASKILFIEILGDRQKICTFAKDGTIKSFFIFPWKPGQNS